jgi:predicted transcriptional regulator YheO
LLQNGAGLLCINFDRSPFVNLEAVLRDFAMPTSIHRPKGLFERDWQDQINTLIREWCQENFKSVPALKQADRTELVGVLESKGLLDYRNSAVYVATALGVSRATVYNALSAARRNRTPGGG